MKEERFAPTFLIFASLKDKVIEGTSGIHANRRSVLLWWLSLGLEAVGSLLSTKILDENNLQGNVIFALISSELEKATWKAFPYPMGM